MKYIEYLNNIVAFNNDPRLVSLREKYNEPSFFEIISKERSETTYSSFLKWLFLINSSRSNGVSPILSFLDILVKRCLQQDDSLINSDLRKAIVSRKLKLTNVSVKTEQYVSELAKRIESSHTDNHSLLEEISNYCQDRIDIYIQGDVSIDQEKKQLQIIIENKIDSKEGGAKPNSRKKCSPEYLKFTKQPQTTRYFKATKQDNNDRVIQLYVFLTPLSSIRLDDFKLLIKEQERFKKENKKVRILREDKNFIQINYQDILDYVVTPLLNSSLSERTRFFLDEFKNELAFPNIEGVDDQSCIAIGKDTSELLTQYWTDYKDNLIIPAIKASVNSALYSIDGIYYLNQPRREVFKSLIDKCGLDWDRQKWILESETKNKNFIEVFGNYQFKKRLSFDDIVKVAQDNEITVSVSKPESDNSIISMLKSFLDENGSLIYALMNGITEKERLKVQNLMPLLSRRDSTKYTIYYNGLCEQTELGYSQTAYNIIRIWAKKENIFSLDKINGAFPRSINNYYERGKWFKNLVYEYSPKGEYEYDDKLEGQVEGNWDFYLKNNDKRHFKIGDGTEVVVLRMWHEEDVENLIEHIKKKKMFTKEELKIIKS